METEAGKEQPLAARMRRRQSTQQLQQEEHQLLRSFPPTTMKTKIVCTLGPASSSEEVLREMIQAGMDMVRLNFSHGTHEEMEALFRTVRRISSEFSEQVPPPPRAAPVLVMDDLRLGDGNGTGLHPVRCPGTQDTHGQG